MQIVIGLVAAQHRAGRGAPLLEPVVPVLDAQAAEGRVQMVRDVARRVDVGQRGPASLVTSTPLSTAAPDAASSSLLGMMPIPATTRSHSRRRPFFVRTRSTR
jgi:hypothetical protein